MSNPGNDLNPSIMFRLIKQLWLDTADFKRPLTNLGACFFEISKGGIAKESILAQWNFLLEHNFVEQISEDPSQYWFTEKGKRIQSEQDLISAISEL